MQGLTQPTLLLKPFCESGDKSTLPDVNTDTSNPQKADLTNGFPPITSDSPDDGGLPPERRDFNALGYLTTSYDYFYQAGGTFTYDATIATAIGGYPKNARLWYTNNDGVSMILRSTKDDNTDNFVTNPSVIGTSWVIETFVGIENSTTNLLDFKFSDKLLTNMSWVLSDGSWLSNTTYTNAYTHICDDIGFMPINDNGTVKIQVANSDYTAGDYIRSSADDLTVSGIIYYAWAYSTDILYVTLDTSAMSADDAVSALMKQRIYKYENPDMLLTVHKITASATDTYTISGNTVTLPVLVGSDGHRVVLVTNNEDTTVDTIYNNIGIAWYYVLDKTNTRFKLPRTKYGFNGYRGTVGGYIQPGLPDHIHHYGQAASDSGFGYAGVGNLGNYNLETQPVRYHDPNSIYGNSDTVQPPATECYLYFYVGGFNDTAIQQTAGITASTINAKMDADVSNITASGKSSIIGYLIPDYTAGVSISTNGGEVPDNGIILAHMYTTDAYWWLSINKPLIDGDYQIYGGGSHNQLVSDTLCVSAGDKIYATNGVSITFYPFKGEI